jgi:DHA3 family macrolide efflux protein-like MFS transporter
LHIALLLLNNTLNLFAVSFVKFALSIWVYQTTQSIFAFSSFLIIGFLPGIVLSPFIGVYVDKLDKRGILIAATGATALAFLLLSVVSGFDALNMVIIGFAIVVISIAEAFEWPAYSVATTLLLPKDKLMRFNAVAESARSLSVIAAPVTAGALYPYIGINGILIIGLVSQLLALPMLIAMKIPDIAATVKTQSDTIRSQAMSGIHFIRENMALRQLLLLFFWLNFAVAFLNVFLVPYTLSFMTEEKAGLARGLFGIGSLTGGIALSLIKTIRHSFWVAAASCAVFALSLILLGQTQSFILFNLLLFIGGMTFPVANGCSQTIWQLNTPVEIQGRVFSIRRMVAWAVVPIGYLLSSPLLLFTQYLINNSAMLTSYFGNHPTGHIALSITLMGTISLLGITFITLTAQRQKIG